MKSPEMKKLTYDVMALGRDVDTGRFHATWGMQEDGSYSEWMDNHDLKVVVQELVQIKRDMRNMMRSKSVQDQMELDMSAMGEEHFQNMVNLDKQFMKEMWGLENCEQLRKRLCAVGHMIKKNLRDCPIAHRLARQVVTLLKFMKKNGELSDMPAQW